MIFSSSLKQIAGLVVFGLLALGLSACNSNPNAADSFTYRVEGVMVVDINRNAVTVAIDLYRDGDKYAGADITLDGRPLVFNPTSYSVDSVYTLIEDSVSNYFSRDLQLVVKDGDSFDQNFSMFVPDSFYIPIDGIRIPANHLLQSAGNVTLDWTSSAGSGGYILAAVHADSTYSSWGYSLLNDPNFGNGGTIPPDAFVLTDGINPDTGLYNIYIYAIGFSPDSVLSDRVLPVPLPEELDDNIDQPAYSARLGTIVIAAYDTVRVQVQTN